MTQAQDLLNALALARKESQYFGHAFLCTEHLLLGLMASETTPAARFLIRRGMEIERLRQALVEHVGRGEQPLDDDPPPSLRTLGILRLAEDMARTYGRSCDTLILLWALLQDRDSDAAQLLMSEGVDLVSWTAALEELMGEPTRRRPRVFSGGGERPAGQVAEMRRWRERLLGAPAFLNDRMVGQSDAIERVSAIITRSWAGLAGAGRPLASFLFAGPGGSGKTTLARNLAELLYQDPERMIRFNMDEFNDEASAWRLTGHRGARPEEQEGILTQVASEYPYSVLYLEDIDRAHPRALDIIAQVLTRGHVTDGAGKRVEFRDHVVVLSVTVEADFMAMEVPVGFRQSSLRPTGIQKIEKSLLPEFERALGGELVEAVDELVFLPPLGKNELRELLQKWTESLTNKLRQRRGIEVDVDSKVLDYLLEQVQDRGAEDLRRAYVRQVENLIAHKMLEGLYTEDSSIKVEMGEGTPQVSILGV
ncbi:MAG: AAA family ATPase [Vulcanimicrobiota bacterium]